jgi:hypothetical protein
MKTPNLPAVSEADAIPARVLQVQLKTRITTRPLHYRSGDEEAAVASVHKLFETTRELLVEHPKAAAFDAASCFLLNDVVRPYTARWHGWMVEGRFADERSRRQFRYELKQLQPQLLKFGECLEHLIAGPDRDDLARASFEEIVRNTPPISRPAELGGEVEAGIGNEIPFKEGELGSGLGRFASVDEINDAEAAFILERRRALAGQPKIPEEEGAGKTKRVMNATGLCLSGGGIRSATFCLGIVQVLARQRLLPQFDYLSTVSGGGYLGTFLSAYLGTPPTGVSVNGEKPSLSQDEIETAFTKAFASEGGRESAAVRHLRNNSRYLLNGGVWGRLKVFGLLVTGILTNVLVMLPIPLLAALGVTWMYAQGYWNEGVERFPFDAPSMAKAVFYALAVCLGLVWFLLPVVRNSARGAAPGSRPVKFRATWEGIALSLGLLTLAAAALLAVPEVLRGLPWLSAQVGVIRGAIQKLASSDALLTGLAAVAPVILGLLAARLKSGRSKRWMAALFALSGPLLYFVVFLLVGGRLFGGQWEWWTVAFVTGVLLVWGWLFVDVNDHSPHGYYRARLCECYLAAPRQEKSEILRGLFRYVLHGRTPGETARESGVGALGKLPLSKMNQTGAAPYHLVHTAANLPASDEPNLRGRDCDFFMFSRDYCGGPVCGYFKTEVLERLDPHVDLGTAMAISGAAASSSMGVKTLRHFRFLITLLNVRLGYWLRNPAKGFRRPWNTPGPRYLLREMVGWMHEKTGYLNLSDGGHIENLALYELLRRRCKFIVVVDGSMEPGMECAELMLAQRYAQIDLGVQMELDLADLALNPQRRSRAYAVFGKIRYAPRNGSRTEDLGWMVYVKLACTGGEPGYVSDYQRQNPNFPHETTADQIYDEAQFEAYRRLGECAAESLFRGELAGKSVNPKSGDGSAEPAFTDIEKWFQALADNLLPDNDPAFNGGSNGSSPGIPQTVIV